MARPPDPDAVAALRDRTVKLSQLREHPSWPELRSCLEERKTKTFAGIQRQLVSGVAIDQRWLDRVAGFFAGAEWLLDNPDMTEQKLQRAVERAALFTEE